MDVVNNLKKLKYLLYARLLPSSEKNDLPLNKYIYIIL
jgi:hypothetical protein